MGLVSSKFVVCVVVIVYCVMLVFDLYCGGWWRDGRICIYVGGYEYKLGNFFCFEGFLEGMEGV